MGPFFPDRVCPLDGGAFYIRFALLSILDLHLSTPDLFSSEHDLTLSSLLFFFRQPPLGSSTTKKRVARTLVENSWDTCID